MALTKAPDTFRRFNWMGGEGTKTSLENTALMRDNGDNTRGAATKRRTREQRARVVREVRCYIDMIKKELYANDEDADAVGMAKSGLKRDMSAAEEEQEASLNLSCLVRGARYRAGEGFTSFYDGTSHGSLETVMEYNDHCRKTLQGLIEDRKLAGEQIEEDPSRAEMLTEQEKVQVEEAEIIELPSHEEYSYCDEDLATLRKPEGEAEEEKANIRAKCDEKAMECARALLQFNLVRNANLYGSFRAQSLSRRASKAQESEPENIEKDAEDASPKEEEVEVEEEVETKANAADEAAVEEKANTADN